MNARTINTIIWLVLLGFITLGLTVCSGPTPMPEPTEVAVLPSSTPLQPTNTSVPPSPTPIPPTATPTETPVPPSPTPVPPTETPTVDPASISSENCIGCHTDEATLQALAEDKEVESEATSGEG